MLTVSEIAINVPDLILKDLEKNTLYPGKPVLSKINSLALGVNAIGWKSKS
jgi:hypothetical protein